MRVAIYARVSTDSQTTENQKLELEQAVRNRGWKVVAIYEDVMSGGKSRDERPGLDLLMQEATRGRFDMIASWSVDRIGRSLQDLITFLTEINKLKVQLYLHQQALDTTTPSGRALFGMLGVFAEFERAIISERVRAGQARARANGARLGQKPIAPEKRKLFLERIACGDTPTEAAVLAGISRSTAYRFVRATKSDYLE